jgi:hypothetical protein
MKGGTQATTSRGKVLMRTKNGFGRGNGPKLLVPIISNNNLTMMINVTSA